MRKKIIKILIIFFAVLVLSFCLALEFSKTKVESTKITKMTLRKPKLFDFEWFLLRNEGKENRRESISDDISILETVYEPHKAPTYEQLKSHTVFITGIIPDKKYEDYMIEKGSSWIGTGFVFKVSDKYTWIITNKHIAGIFANKEGETTELYIGDTKKERVKAQIVRFHPKYDIVLLMVHGKLEGKRQVRGLSTAKPQDKVYVVGHHLGRPYIYGEGVFAGYQKKKRNSYL